jgi:hypothetical protein
VTETKGQHPAGDGWWVTQDPTELTNTAVTQAKDDLRRELASDRELLAERIGRVDAFVKDVDARLKGDIADSVNALEALLVQRITGLEQIMRMLDQVLKNAPQERDDLRERLQTDIATAVGNLQHLHEERFRAIDLQFNERDVRSEQEKKASKEALDAALLAQKESVSQQNDANTTAATKSETSFTKQVDQIAILIATLEKALTDRLTELKERIDRGEGSTSGVAVQRTDQRASIGTVIAAVATLVAVISFVLVIIKK